MKTFASKASSKAKGGMRRISMLITRTVKAARGSLFKGSGSLSKSGENGLGAIEEDDETHAIEGDDETPTRTRTHTYTRESERKSITRPTYEPKLDITVPTEEEEDEFKPMSGFRTSVPQMASPNTREKGRSRKNMRKSVIRTCMRQSTLIPTKVGCEHFHRDSLEKKNMKKMGHKLDNSLITISVGGHAPHYDENHHPEPLVHFKNKKLQTCIFDFDQTLSCDHVYKLTGGRPPECLQEYTDEHIIHWFGGTARIGVLSELIATLEDEEIVIIILSHGFRPTILKVIERVLAMEKLDEEGKEGFKLLKQELVYGRDEINKTSDGDKGEWIESYMEERDLTFDQVMFCDDDEANVLPIMQDNTCMTILVGGDGLSLDEMDELQKLAVNPDYEPPMVGW